MNSNCFVKEKFDGETFETEKYELLPEEKDLLKGIYAVAYRQHDEEIWLDARSFDESDLRLIMGLDTVSYRRSRKYKKTYSVEEISVLSYSIACQVENMSEEEHFQFEKNDSCLTLQCIPRSEQIDHNLAALKRWCQCQNAIVTVKVRINSELFGVMRKYTRSKPE